MKDLLIDILIGVLSYSLGKGTLMRQVISGRVDISGRRYECRDIGPAGR